MNTERKMDEGVLTLRKRNQITLPKKCLLGNVSQLKWVVQEDGTILLIPLLSIPADQAYFWTKRWQEGEGRADEDIKAGRVYAYQSAQEMVREMKKKRKLCL